MDGEVIVDVYTHSVSSKYSLDPIQRAMKSTGTPVEPPDERKRRH